MLVETTYFLASADFNGAVFTHANFQKMALGYPSDFHYTSEGIPSFMCFRLLMT